MQIFENVMINGDEGHASTLGLWSAWSVMWAPGTDNHLTFLGWRGAFARRHTRGASPLDPRRSDACAACVRTQQA